MPHEQHRSGAEACQCCADACLNEREIRVRAEDPRRDRERADLRAGGARRGVAGRPSRA